MDLSPACPFSCFIIPCFSVFYSFFIYFYLSLFCCRATCRGLNFSAKVIASPSHVNAGIQPQVKRKNLPLRW
ncbi:hypothetical protein BACCOPRO_03720 [Phocaeicola coprophilus DSM 18228 = JCM 13818]|uniref:Uncharacterized protein n=1 Tax=Phocaeicola coprophilus DSM 18228 = JCM 13818 TaxID=547042 RepID=S0FDG8_9BACT|nr:hypothetical protein BACCOPRO_03720 [Phocaeicola coprophilus DSM 18228 = JCM 13818]